MVYRSLGTTDLRVSAVCLGTMTWGEQNSEADGHAQMDLALEAGVNFWDAAEMYPVPPRAETYGETERIIGSWFASRGRRDRVVLATKVSGPGRMPHIRNGNTRLSRANIMAACEASLKRLNTDYIDLFQVHWPDRATNNFGKLDYVPIEEPGTIPLEESLRALCDLVKAGKVRAIGLSNETPWGVMHSVRAADTLACQRIVSIQNPYSLLNRSFEIGLAEIAMRERVGLLAYSPLAMGMLSGKYEGGAQPEGARLTLYPSYTRYTNPRGRAATSAYVAIARKHGLDPAQMAIAFVLARPFVTSCIVGATTIQQLQANIDAIDLRLTPEILAELDAVHQDNPNPCP